MENCVPMEWGEAGVHERECLFPYYGVSESEGKEGGVEEKGGEGEGEEGEEGEKREKKTPEEVCGEETASVVRRRKEEVRREREALLG